MHVHISQNCAFSAAYFCNTCMYLNSMFFYMHVHISQKCVFFFCILLKYIHESEKFFYTHMHKSQKCLFSAVYCRRCFLRSRRNVVVFLCVIHRPSCFLCDHSTSDVKMIFFRLHSREGERERERGGREKSVLLLLFLIAVFWNFCREAEFRLLPPPT
jgi:hypothetical protein